MLRAYAQVITCDDDSAVLIAERKTACGSCAAAKGCGVSSLTKIINTKTLRFQTQDIAAPRQGDWYEIGMPHHAILKMAAVIYMVPLLFMILIAIFASLMGAGDLVVAITSFGGLAIGYWCVRWLVGTTDLNRLAKPVILHRVAMASGASDDFCHVPG